MQNAEAVLRRRRRETASAATLELEFRGPGFAYRPGQHLRIDPHQFTALVGPLADRAAKRGKPEGPAYFAISSDGLSDGVLEITVKLGRPGGSPITNWLLEGLPEGGSIRLEGAGGSYGYPDPLPADVDAFVHVCAGSGVAPDRGMIRHALAKGWAQRQLLILQERGPADVIFAREWEELGADGRFRFRPLYSSEGRRVSTELVREALAGCADPARSIAFVCGPNEPREGRPGWADQATRALSEAGFAPDRIRV